MTDNRLEERDPREDGCLCQLCGVRYKIDFMLPDNLWAEIQRLLPRTFKLLCGTCTVSLLEQRGAFDYFDVVKLDARPAVAADARELVHQWAKENHPGTLRTNQASLIQRVTAYANQRDAEVREVLEGLRGRSGCWCGTFDNHSPECLAARALYEKLH